MAKTKKQLTTTQEKNKYNRISKATYFGQYIAMATPYIAIGIANYNEYFVEYDGTKVSISFIMAMIVMGLTIYGQSKDKFKDSSWSLMIKMLILAFITYMLGSLITDLSFILLCGSIGLAGSGVLNKVSQKYAIKRDEIKDAQAEARKDLYKQKAKEESNEGSILG